MGFEQNVKNMIVKAITIAGNATLLSQATGVSMASISLWKNGKASPHVRELAPIVDWLENNSLTPMVTIPMVEAKAGAGSSLETGGDTVGEISFSSNIFDTMRASAHSTVVLEVVGESMRPLLEPGDLILVDSSKKVLNDGKLYLVGYNDELLVKRVFKRISGLILRSQNPEFPDVIVDSSELEQIRIYGTVVGMLRRFRVF